MASKAWKEQNPEKLKAYRNEWYERNKEAEQIKARERQSKRRKEVSEWWRDYKAGLSCEECGFDHPAAIDFHHKDPSEKDLDLARMVITRSKEAVLKEIEKCKILCANCHRIYHYNEKNTGACSKD